MDATAYRPELDLVALDGTFAASCIVWFDESNVFGVHSAHRQRGLGMAVLYAGSPRLHH